MDGIGLRGAGVVPVAMQGGGQGAQPISPPPGWNWTLPFQVYYNAGLGTFNTGTWDISDEMVMTGGDIYCGKGGNDGWNGLTYGTRKLTLDAAMIACPANGRVLLYAGRYGWVDGWTGGWPVAKNVSLIGMEAGCIIDTYFTGGAWSATGGLTDTYQCAFAVGAPRHVLDYGLLDGDGVPTRYTLRANTADVDANAGSYYWAANVLYVHTLDGGSPDADVRPQYSGGYGIRINQDNRKAYMENVTVYSAPSQIMNASAAGGSTAYFKNCNLFLCKAGEVDLQGADAILQGCKVGHCITGDIIAGYARNTVVCKVIEIDCEVFDAGEAGDTDHNASTNHNAGKNVILNGEYYNTYGPPIGYINSGHCWLLGTYSHHNLSTPSANDANYQMQEAIAYLDHCTSSDSGHDITATLDVYVREFTGDATNNGAGSVITY